MNFVQIVGYILEIPVREKNGSVEKFSRFNIEVCSNFRQSDGNYAKVILPVRIWHGAHSSIIHNVKINDTIAIKGRLDFDEFGMLVIAEQFERLRFREYP